jgi:hypothetical protein
VPGSRPGRPTRSEPVLLVTRCDHKRQLTAKGNGARRVHALIGAALHSAERWDLVEKNVARRADPPPVRAARVKAPSPKDVQALLMAAEKTEPALAVLLLLAALTGAPRLEMEPRSAGSIRPPPSFTKRRSSSIDSG